MSVKHKYTPLFHVKRAVDAGSSLESFDRGEGLSCPSSGCSGMGLMALNLLNHKARQG